MSVDFNRRHAMRALSCCAGVPVIAALGAGAARAQDSQSPSVMAPAPAGLSPDDALELLRAGNAEYITDAPFRGAENRARRLEIAAGQHPFVVLVGCSDSRVSPELLFGRGLGELFIIRVAGNTVDVAGLGSIEYAVAEFGVPLIVVLGHERCGAVSAAVEVVENNATFPGRIGDMIEPIIPAVLSVRNEPGDLLANAVRANIRRVAGGLPLASTLLADLVSQGKVKIVGAHYDLEDEVVEFLKV